MRMCLNRKIVIGFCIAAVGVLVVDPHVFTRVLPLLLISTCPLSMLFMLRSMSGNKASGAIAPSGRLLNVDTSNDPVSNTTRIDGGGIPAFNYERPSTDVEDAPR